jgi:hypothetical protein
MIEMKRKNKVLKIIVEPSKSKLDNLKKRDVLNYEPNDIINNNWENGWNAKMNQSFTVQLAQLNTPPFSAIQLALKGTT